MRTDKFLNTHICMYVNKCICMYVCKIHTYVHAYKQTHA